MAVSSITQGRDRASPRASLMTASNRSILFASALVLAATLTAVTNAPALAAPADDLEITIDEAKIVQLKRPAAEIILGNPLIADVSVQSGKVVVVTGKSFGRTNLIVLDGDGKEIINGSISVEESGKGIVAVHKGSLRSTYYCAPNCTSTLAIGDNPDYFDAVSKQIQAKLSLSRGAAEGVGGSGGE